MNSLLLKAVHSLSFARDTKSQLEDLPAEEWRRLLTLTDRSQLTLPLGVRCANRLPPWVRERIESNLKNNAVRFQRTKEIHQSVQAALTSRGIEFAVLKGFTQSPFYCDDLRVRPQYDLDLYCPQQFIAPAYETLKTLGYEPFRPESSNPLDHLPPLIRKTGWRPRGDYYDADMPLTLELHFRFWDQETECFDVHGSDTFWERRRVRNIEGLSLPTLDPADGLSYASWHLIRHLLRGDLRAYHVYELAHFLHRTEAKDEFWQGWRARAGNHDALLAESMAFRLAIDWFECGAHPVARELAQSMPFKVNRWFEEFGLSPLYALEQPNKDELFLHLAIVQGLNNRLSIAKRRLMPFRFSPVVVDAHVPSPDAGLRWKRRIFGVWFMAKRAIHHARTVWPFIRNGRRWRKALAAQPPLASGRRPHAGIARP